MARLATTCEKLVASRANPVAQVATSSPAMGVCQSVLAHQFQSLAYQTLVRYTVRVPVYVNEENKGFVSIDVHWHWYIAIQNYQYIDVGTLPQNHCVGTKTTTTVRQRKKQPINR